MWRLANVLYILLLVCMCMVYVRICIFMCLSASMSPLSWLEKLGSPANCFECVYIYIHINTHTHICINKRKFISLIQWLSTTSKIFWPRKIIYINIILEKKAHVYKWWEENNLVMWNIKRLFLWGKLWHLI